jgi:hypothetical protein
MAAMEATVGHVVWTAALRKSVTADIGGALRLLKKARNISAESA